MNWEAIGAVGEIIGALAVVITLFYLAVQLREAKRATDRNSDITIAATYQSRAETSQQMMAVIAESEHIAPLLARIREGGGFPKFSIDDLSEEENKARCEQLDNYHKAFEGADDDPNQKWFNEITREPSNF